MKQPPFFVVAVFFFMVLAAITLAAPLSVPRNYCDLRGK